MIPRHPRCAGKHKISDGGRAGDIYMVPACLLFVLLYHNQILTMLQAKIVKPGTQGIIVHVEVTEEMASAQNLTQFHTHTNVLR